MHHDLENTLHYLAVVHITTSQNKANGRKGDPTRTIFNSVRLWITRKHASVPNFKKASQKFWLVVRIQRNTADIQTEGQTQIDLESVKISIVKDEFFSSPSKCSLHALTLQALVPQVVQGTKRQNWRARNFKKNKPTMRTTNTKKKCSLRIWETVSMAITQEALSSNLLEGYIIPLRESLTRTMSYKVAPQQYVYIKAHYAMKHANRQLQISLGRE